MRWVFKLVWRFFALAGAETLPWLARKLTRKDGNGGGLARWKQAAFHLLCATEHLRRAVVAFLYLK